ncbi:PLP-dependent aminotransferase family protein [Rhodococcus sp. T2V]|uniref:aminotransferase-like domain-containing protein n=1 Tax=Rhodococcus sp. T2V TaxID=3034164 RepID=UPI0023E0F07E|nr:PLP-dependent aminotransferase family protein [Rhodococcus sp. T2V]
MISFAGGAPDLGELDFDKLAHDASRILLDSGPVAMQYGAGQGVEKLRRQICSVMELEGVTAAPKDVVVTCGSQQALDLAARVLIDPGDVVFVEGPTYAGGMAVFSGLEAEIVHVDTDADGLNPGDLERKITAVRAAGKSPKALYTIPTFQNPGGTILPSDRRTAVGQLCRQHNILIFEDNPYGLLRFDDTMTPAIVSEFPDITLYFGSFSKMFAPGLRIGWVHAPAHLVPHLVTTHESTVLNPSVYSQLMMSAYLSNSDWMSRLEKCRRLYSHKCDVMLAGLEHALPAGSRWNRPRGGFYIWASVSERFDTESLVYECIDRGVVFVPGTAFYVDGSGRNELRLSFCLPSVDQINTGLQILGEVFTENGALRATAGAGR